MRNCGIWWPLCREKAVRTLNKNSAAQSIQLRASRALPMKTNMLATIILAFSLLTLRTEEQPSFQFDALTPRGYVDWDDPEWWESVARTKSPGLALGKSDFVMHGPLIETFRPSHRPLPTDRSWFQKALDLPIVSLFVPRPMPVPPISRGNYFAWGERSVPWSTTADPWSPLPSGALVSVGW
jgi:hypothetical protein